MQIHESVEDYLEKILMPREENGRVRFIEIASTMGYSGPGINIVTVSYIHFRAYET